MGSCGGEDIEIPDGEWMSEILDSNEDDEPRPKHSQPKGSGFPVHYILRRENYCVREIESLAVNRQETVNLIALGLPLP